MFALWRHQMETFSALLTLWGGNSPIASEFPSQRPVTRSFDVFFDLHLNKRLSKPSRRRWFETPPPSLWRHCNGILLIFYPRYSPVCGIMMNSYGLALNVYQPISDHRAGYGCSVAWTYQGPLLLTWISNYIHFKVSEEITYSFLNFNGTTVEV